MTEENFKRGVSKTNKTIANEDRDRFVYLNSKLIDAIIYLKERDAKGLDIDDWECWLSKLIFTL